MKLCQGRVAVVTGAGRGLGRAHALALAADGAAVVVNDLGVELDGAGEPTSGPARDVADEIIAAGGQAVANGDDVADPKGAAAIVQQALENFGRLDVVVNNAGIVRDHMIVNMTIEEFDAVVRVHLRGTFCMTAAAARLWRGQSKDGADVDARIINTTSIGGLGPSPGQANYASAKGAIAALTLTSAEELGRYGVTVNAVCPGARTRMSADTVFGREPLPDKFDKFDPAHVSPAVVWLASPDSKDVTGQVIQVSGAILGLMRRWSPGATEKTGRHLDPTDMGAKITELLELQDRQ